MVNPSLQGSIINENKKTLKCASNKVIESNKGGVAFQKNDFSNFVNNVTPY